MQDKAIDASRPSMGRDKGVHFEREPFGPTKTGSADTGAATSGRFVEFDEPAGTVPTRNVGRRNTGMVETETPLDISDLNPTVGRQ